MQKYLQSDIFHNKLFLILNAPFQISKRKEPSVHDAPICPLTFSFPIVDKTPSPPIAQSSPSMPASPQKSLFLLDI